jgi:hypothetical protein
MNTDAVINENRATMRAWLLLGGLAAVALIGALLVSLFVPAEWSDPFASLRPPDSAVTGTPVPGTVPATPDRRGILRSDGRAMLGTIGLDGISNSSFLGRVASLLLILGVGTLTLYLLPRRVGRLAQAVQGGGVALARLFLVGLAGYIVLAALGVLGAITIFGAPAGLLLLILAYALVPLGLAAISLPLGRAAGRRLGVTRAGPLVDLLAGLLIIYILSLIPLLGLLLLYVLAILGFGAVVLTRAGSAQGWDFDLSEVRY